MKNKMSAMALIAMAGIFEANMHRSPIMSEETKEQKERRKQLAKVKQNKAKGMKLFNYGENSLWSINQKNADKKAKKKGWL